MTDIQTILADIEAGLEGVTPGPWEESPPDSFDGGGGIRPVDDEPDMIGTPTPIFIAYDGYDDEKDGGLEFEFNRRWVVATQPANMRTLIAAYRGIQRMVAWANNSLFGSHNFFGEGDEHHLDRKIEELKSFMREYGARAEKAEAENAVLKAGIKRLSDEEELTSETGRDGMLSAVRIGARLAEAEELARSMEAEANQMREVSIQNRDRAGKAEAERDELAKAVAPFADVADFMDSETSGFSMTDTLHLQIPGTPGTYLVDCFCLQRFYDARAALSRIKGGDGEQR